MRLPRRDHALSRQLAEIQRFERVDHAVSQCHVPVSRDGVYYITNLLVERSRARESGAKRLVDLHFEARSAPQARPGASSTGRGRT